LPKDTQALLHTFKSSGAKSHVLAAAIKANQHRRAALADRVVAAVGHTPDRVAVWGLTFKAGTDDVRDSPSIDLIQGLTRRGIDAVVYDPLVSDLPDDLDAKIAGSALEAAAGADAVVIATEWPEFKEVDLNSAAAAMSGTTIVDLRNFLTSEAVNAAGLDHHPLGNLRSLAADYSR
ncbi:MAG: UDP binding domain-containing protein, partial [Gemmatimonadota bacterium]